MIILEKQRRNKVGTSKKNDEEYFYSTGQKLIEANVNRLARLAERDHE